MALYFLFDDMRYNLLLYFSVLTIILELFGHEKIMPSLKKINAAPMVQTPAGDIGGILMSTKYGRNIHAYKGEISGKDLINSLDAKFIYSEKATKNLKKKILWPFLNTISIMNFTTVLYTAVITQENKDL